jgi:hypothetical protein
MSEAQRRYLYRLLSSRGIQGEQAARAICQALDVQDLKCVMREAASNLIEEWTNGGVASRPRETQEEGHAAANGNA